MDMIDILPEYLDTGMVDGEIKNLAVSTIRNHLTQLKQAIANSVISARSHTLMDNLKGADTAMEQARKLQTQYHYFLSELSRLVNESTVPTSVMDGINIENNGEVPR